MGRQHEDGYSADVEGFLIVRGNRFRLAKTNGETLTLAQPCELPPDTEGEMRITVDGDVFSRRVVLPAGVSPGQSTVAYEVAAPF